MPSHSYRSANSAGSNGNKAVPLENAEFENGLPDFLDPPAEEVRFAREQRISRLRFLWENRKWLFRVFVWSVLVSGVITLLIPNHYEAVERLMPPDNQSGMGAAILSALSGRGGNGPTASAGAIAGDLLGAKTSGALFVGVLSSRTVQDRLIDDFNLKKIYHESEIEDARKELSKHTTISEDRKSGIISIWVTDHDPRRAAAMAQAYVAELDRLVAQVSTSSARRERIFLEGRLTSVKQELDTSANKFSDFASKNTAIDIPAQGKAMVEAAAVLQGQLIAAESELRGLQAIYTDQNVRVKSLRARVTELKAQLGKMGGDANAPPPGPENTDPSSYPTIRQLPVLGVTYTNLYRQTKIEEIVYEMLRQQYEVAKVQEAKEIPSVKVLDAAVVPTKKSFPPRIVFTLIGALLGVTGGAFWLFWRRRWVALDPHDPGKALALEVFQTLREDSKRFSPATAAVSRVMSRHKNHQEDDSSPNDPRSGGENPPEKGLGRAAGGGAK